MMNLVTFCSFIHAESSQRAQTVQVGKYCNHVLPLVLMDKLLAVFSGQTTFFFLSCQQCMLETHKTSITSLLA